MLLNIYNFLPRQFASKKGHHTETRGVLIDPAAKVTAATDRYTLLQVTAPLAELSDFPIVPGNPTEAPAAAHIMPAKAAQQIEGNLKKIKSAALPILTHAAPLKIEQENTAGYVITDLEQAEPVIYRTIDGKFPDYAQIIPGKDKKAIARVVLHADFLKRMAAAFMAAGTVTVEFYGEYEPVKFTGKISSTQQDITGLIMPIKE